MARKIIKQMLKERGKTAGYVARKLKVSYEAVYKAMDGGCSRRIRVFIARLLEMSPSMLWKGETDPQVLLLDDYEYMHGV